MCQLCSTNSEKSEESFRLGKGCTSFVFEREQPSQVRSINLIKTKTSLRHALPLSSMNILQFTTIPYFLMCAQSSYSREHCNTQTDS